MIIVFSAVHRLFKNARANDTTGNVRACDVFLIQVMDGSIDKSRRERSLRGPRKKVNDLGICGS